jgi:hypothetical protein
MWYFVWIVTIISSSTHILLSSHQCWQRIFLYSIRQWRYKWEFRLLLWVFLFLWLSCLTKWFLTVTWHSLGRTLIRNGSLSIEGLLFLYLLIVAWNLLNRLHWLRNGLWKTTFSEVCLLVVGWIFQFFFDL